MTENTLPMTLVRTGSNLDVVPDEVWEASDKLSKLDLSHNSISQFPAERLESCHQLRSLMLNDNRYSEPRLWNVLVHCIV